MKLLAKKEIVDLIKSDQKDIKKTKNYHHSNQVAIFSTRLNSYCQVWEQKLVWVKKTLQFLENIIR